LVLSGENSNADGKEGVLIYAPAEMAPVRLLKWYNSRFWVEKSKVPLLVAAIQQPLFDIFILSG
jgi:hypothetical protein